MIITLIVSCLERLICLFLFIMVEFEKVAYRTDITQITLSHEMLSHTMVSNMPDGLRLRPSGMLLSVQPPPPPGKLAAQLKSPFGNSCLPYFHYMQHLSQDVC